MSDDSAEKDAGLPPKLSARKIGIGAKKKPAKPEPAKAEPPKPEPAKAEPPKPEPAEAAPARPAPTLGSLLGTPGPKKQAAPKAAP